MIGFRVKNAKDNFFDRTPVIAAVGKAQAGILSHDGSFLRRTAKGLIRNAAPTKLAKVKQARRAFARARQGPARLVALQVLVAAQRAASAPERQPPRNVKGHLKEKIYFSWDPSTRSLVVGPEKLGAGLAPRALEEGGPSITTFRRGNQTFVRRVTVRPHPYMGPALKKEIAKGSLLSPWQNAIVKAAG